MPRPVSRPRQAMSAAAACLAATLSQAEAQPPGARPAVIAGRATVIDGATLEVRGERIRLAGIAQAADDHVCARTDDERWRCGPRAVNALDELLQEAIVTCTAMARYSGEVTVATCTAGSVDLSLWLIRNGLARAAPDGSYARAEGEAKAAHRGIWAGMSAK